jgi:hypothetical protein
MLVMARFRSIENRMHVIRATNTGISAFIEPTGRVQAKLEVDGRCKEVEGWRADPPDRATSLTGSPATGRAGARSGGRGAGPALFR